MSFARATLGFDLCFSGSDSLATAVVDLFKGLSKEHAANIKVQDAMLLLVVAYCLAAQNALALQGPSAGDLSSPWDLDQENTIKVERLQNASQSHRWCALCRCCLFAMLALHCIAAQSTSIAFSKGCIGAQEWLTLQLLYVVCYGSLFCICATQRSKCTRTHRKT